MKSQRNILDELLELVNSVNKNPDLRNNKLPSNIFLSIQSAIDKEKKLRDSMDPNWRDVIIIDKDGIKTEKQYWIDAKYKPQKNRPLSKERQKAINYCIFGGIFSHFFLTRKITILCYKKALSIDPDYFPAKFNLAFYLCNYEKNYAESLSLNFSLLYDDFLNKDVWYNIGSIFLVIGYYSFSCLFLEISYILDPNNSEVIASIEKCREKMKT